MSFIGLSIVIVYEGTFHTGNRSLLVLEGMQQRFQSPTQKFHLRVAVNFCLLGRIELSRPSRIDGTTHPAGGSHQGGLWFQAAVGGLSIEHISRGVVLLENGGVVMLQDDIPLRIRNFTYNQHK